MNNIELLKILNDVDEKFLTEEYQPTINKRYKTSFKERVSKMKNIRLKYVFAPISVVIIALISIIVFNVNKNNSDNIIIAKNNSTIVEESNQKQEDTHYENDKININELGITNQLDINAKSVKVNLTDEFEFINNIYIPENLKEFEQSKVYVNKNIEDTNYSEFKQYRVLYTDKIEGENRNIEFNFSKNKLLPDCIPTGLENGEVSIIDKTPVKIYASVRKDEPTVISGESYFEYNNYKFDIKVYRITQEDFIKVVSSIIKEVKVDKAMLVDEDVGVNNFNS